MLKVFEWQNIKTGKVVEHDHWSEPPDLPGKWQRIFTVGVGRVEGAGGSPAMPSTKLKKSKKEKRADEGA